MDQTLTGMSDFSLEVFGMPSEALANVLAKFGIKAHYSDFQSL